MGEDGCESKNVRIRASIFTLNLLTFEGDCPPELRICGVRPVRGGVNGLVQRVVKGRSRLGSRLETVLFW